MKTKVFTLVMIGVLGLVSMGFRPASGGSYTDGTSVTIVKGTVYSTDKGNKWDEVTFGLNGMQENNYIAYIEFFDKHGRSLGRTYDWQFNGKDGDTDWFLVDLADINVRHEFTMEVHVSSIVNGGGVNSTTTLGVAAPPIGPGETVLIVKYP